MADNLDLSDDELALLQRWRGQSGSLLAYFGYYGAILLPMVAFAGYGVLMRDVIALAIAFAGLLLYQLQRIFADLSRTHLYQSLATKLAERESRDKKESHTA